MIRSLLTTLLILAWVPSLHAEDLTIDLGSTTKPVSASANSSALKLKTSGTVSGSTIHFVKLLPTVPYDVAVTLADGTVLQGVNMGWYNPEPVHADTDPMTDEDRAEVTSLVTPDKDFFNHIDIVLLAGDHNRATALVKQIRDKAFHSDKGGEIISRYELWYFRFESGAWAKVQQGQKVLRRDRFTSNADYEKTMGPIRWTPALGGITLGKGENKTIKLTASTGGTTAASSSSPPSSTRPAP